MEAISFSNHCGFLAPHTETFNLSREDSLSFLHPEINGSKQTHIVTNNLKAKVFIGYKIYDVYRMPWQHSVNKRTYFLQFFEIWLIKKSLNASSL